MGENTVNVMWLSTFGKKNGLRHLPLGDGQGLLAIKNSEKFHQKEAHYIWLAHGYLTSLVTEFFVLAALTLPGGARALWWEVASL